MITFKPLQHHWFQMYTMVQWFSFFYKSSSTLQHKRALFCQKQNVRLFNPILYPWPKIFTVTDLITYSGCTFICKGNFWALYSEHMFIATFSWHTVPQVPDVFNNDLGRLMGSQSLMLCCRGGTNQDSRSISVAFLLHFRKPMNKRAQATQKYAEQCRGSMIF